MRPNMSRSAQFLWSASSGWAAVLCVDLDETEEEQTCQRSPLPDGINVAEESAGKRFKVEWDFRRSGGRSKSLSI